MKNYVKKMVMTMAVCAMSVTAFAAEPVFDSPQEEAAFWAQQKQAAAWEEAHGNYNITRENPVYFVTANPFDILGAAEGTGCLGRSARELQYFP